MRKPNKLTSIKSQQKQPKWLKKTKGIIIIEPMLSFRVINTKPFKFNGKDYQYHWTGAIVRMNKNRLK